ncbi:MAG: phage tail sheath subtilisin-like domain-containing protein [Planctomycetes bacterium]|nr:phage tail sheath subtilisin-like domain-containing protein [Planctomycetota bacterium]
MQPTGGAGTPDLAGALAFTGGEHFNVMAVPYTDAAILGVLEQDLADRAGPTRMQGSVAFTATPLGWGEALAFGDGRNSEYVSAMSCFGSPSTPWEWAAALAAAVSESASVHPAQPFQTLALRGISAPAEADRYGMTENNGLLYDGIATHTVDSGGVVRIQRTITMHQTDATGSQTVALLDVNTLLTLERLRFDLRNRFAQKYPRAMLGDDRVRSAPGQIVMTPSTARAEVIGLFNEWIGKGFVESPDQFEQDLQVERNTEDPNRLDIILRPNLMNQLRVFGAKIQFKL